ncbi:hypothetical protein [Limosilactobacillus fermentum]
MDKAWNKETESEKICERIKRCFTNRWRTRYWVSVVYYEPEGTIPCQVDTYKNENTIFLIQPNRGNIIYHSAKEKALSCFKEAIHPPLVEVGVFSPIMDKCYWNGRYHWLRRFATQSLSATLPRSHP